MSKSSVYIQSVGMISALGADRAAHEQTLFDHSIRAQDCLQYSSFYSEQSLPLGLAGDELPLLPEHCEQSRNNRLLLAAVQQIQDQVEAAKSRYGAQRIGVLLGTSTSGISDGEQAIDYYCEHDCLPEAYSYRLQEPFAPSRFLASFLGVNGPCWTLSSACTSGGKALASAARLLKLGVCDAVIAGGVDTLCRMTVAGFSSLGVTSEQYCRPFERQRNGINIGEAAAVFLLSHEPADISLSGWGESSDAHHISAPDPSGAGAEAAMRGALRAAGLQPDDIDYLNFHGTATQQNDKMEAEAAARIFSQPLACGSTKSLTGHTLGAAGALEAAICYLSLRNAEGRLPAHCWSGDIDPELPELPGLNTTELASQPRFAMSNSFAFGGNNLSLILGRA